MELVVNRIVSAGHIYGFGIDAMWKCRRSLAPDKSHSSSENQAIQSLGFTHTGGTTVLETNKQDSDNHLSTVRKRHDRLLFGYSELKW